MLNHGYVACSMDVTLPVYAASVGLCSAFQGHWRSMGPFPDPFQQHRTSHNQIWEIRGFRETSTQPKWEILPASHCTLSVFTFPMQLLEYFLVFFLPSSCLLLSHPHFPQTVMSFNPSSNFLPKHMQATDQDREQRPFLIGMVMNIVHLARAAPTGMPQCLILLQIHTCPLSQWIAQIWNLIPGGLGGRLFYLFSLQRKANRMGTHRSWERNISQVKHTGALKKQDVQDVMPGYTLVPLLIMTNLEKK